MKPIYSKSLETTKSQYENYPYPPVDPRDEKKRLLNPVTDALDTLNHYCFEGKKDFSRNFRVLVAGGGTGDAVIFLAEQLRDTSAEIIYVDLSSASMAIAQERAKIRGLTNIRWINDSLLEIPGLDLGNFDYINSSGVLHHLPNPDEGLKVLADSLKPDGAMGIMVYAKYGRMAVYQIQELLRIVNRGEENQQEQVENAKKILKSLPALHWLNFSPSMILDEVKCGDAGIYDLYLHSQDRAYSIPELYDWVEGAGLFIQHLFSTQKGVENNLYDPDLYVRDKGTLARISMLPTRDRRAIAELLNSKIIQHTFYCMKNPLSPADLDNADNIPFFAIHFDSEHFQNVPLQVIANSGSVVSISDSASGIQITFPKTRNTFELYKNIDGRKTIGEIIEAVRKKSDSTEEDLKLELKTIIRGFLNHNLILLRHKSVPPFKTTRQIQANLGFSFE